MNQILGHMNRGSGPLITIEHFRFNFFLLAFPLCADGGACGGQTLHTDVNGSCSLHLSFSEPLKEPMTMISLSYYMSKMYYDRFDNMFAIKGLSSKPFSM